MTAVMTHLYTFNSVKNSWYNIYLQYSFFLQVRLWKKLQGIGSIIQLSYKKRKNAEKEKDSKVKEFGKSLVLVLLNYPRMRWRLVIQNKSHFQLFTEGESKHRVFELSYPSAASINL